MRYMEYDNCYPGHYVQWFFFVLGFFLFTIVIVMMVGKLLSWFLSSYLICCQS